MSALFTTTCRVEFSDTDMAGIVHFTNFYRWMEYAEHAWFRSLGLKIIEKQQDGSFKELDVEYLVFSCLKTN